MSQPVIRPVLYQGFCDPVTHDGLDYSADGLANPAGTVYQFIESGSRIVDFVAPVLLTTPDKANLEAYNSDNSTQIYRNFLDWLFTTFEENEDAFRRNLVKKLNLAKGMKVLITGCGLGEDIPLIMNLIGAEGELHAQDLSKSMVMSASNLNHYTNLCFSISNATLLPYQSRYFDAVYHFGGINLFGDTQKAISELERVCKIGGKVLFGDEGIAPHLRGSQFAEIAINNNKLWESTAPIHLLPHNALDIEITYILGNCFYLIAFTPSAGLPKMNIDVMHKGLRGGSARTRYFGRLEGVTDNTRNKLLTVAKKRNISLHSLLEEMINANIPDAGDNAR